VPFPPPEKPRGVPAWRWSLVLALLTLPLGGALLLSFCRDEQRREAEAARAAASAKSAAEKGSDANAEEVESIVSRGQPPIMGVVTDGTRVYFTEKFGQRILSAPVRGGEERVVGSAHLPLDIAQNETDLFVADTGGLMGGARGTITAYPKSGAREPRVLASEIVMPNALAVSATHVYWTDGGSVERDYVDGFVGRAPLEGGPQSVIAAGEREPNGIAVSATHVYWGRHQKGGLGELVRMPIEGGAIEIVAGGQRRIKRITIVGDAIYWISSQDTADAGAVIRKIGVGGGAPVDVVETERHICSMIVDGDAVYWSEPGDASSEEASGRILKKRLANGEPKVLASLQEKPCYVAVDATHVYFSTQSKDRLKRRRKNPADEPR